jgi:hypothetical protein
VEDGKACNADRVSIVSGASGRSKTTSQLVPISSFSVSAEKTGIFTSLKLQTIFFPENYAQNFRISATKK